MRLEELIEICCRGRGREENLAVACRRCNRRRGTGSVVGYVRAQRREGRQPRIDVLAGALARLARSSSRAHADYGRRQLALQAAVDLLAPDAQVAPAVTYTTTETAAGGPLTQHRDRIGSVAEPGVRASAEGRNELLEAGL